MTWIADLNTRTLKEARQQGLRLELHYAPSAKADVRRMIVQEQECCAFLLFDIIEEGELLMLTITAPDDACDAAETVLGPFQEKTLQPAARGCTGQRAA